MKTMSDYTSEAFERKLRDFIAQALLEDIGSGDISALAALNPDRVGEAQCIIKDSGILAGVDLAGRIFKQFDTRIAFNPILRDGTRVAAGYIAFKVKGPQSSLLSAERVVLNCMQRMSGIATLTHEVQQAIAHTSCKVLDTRKTTPNFRIAEKWAVHIGGGLNHRMGLYDMIMLKDNHIDYCGSVSKAIEKSLDYLQEHALKIPIVVETRNLEEVAACLPFAAHIHRILLDNMSVPQINDALKLINGTIPTEASGGITRKNVVQIAETGVDYVSMGSIIYDAAVLDMSLKAL